MDSNTILIVDSDNDVEENDKEECKSTYYKPNRPIRPKSDYPDKYFFFGRVAPNGRLQALSVLNDGKEDIYKKVAELAVQEWPLLPSAQTMDVKNTVESKPKLKKSWCCL